LAEARPPALSVGGLFILEAVMPVKEMSESIILEIAARYGIKVVWTMGVPSKFEGPALQGCDSRKRVLYFREDKRGDVEVSIEHYFHELVHVIVQPPWRRWSIERTPEEFILFQFERALARAVLEDWAYDLVVDWQCNTYAHILTFSLDHDALYERRAFWRLGFKMCRMLGLLDQKNRPTYRRPRWDRLTPFEAELYDYYRALGVNPTPRLG
jgi:hypothetical protein